MRRLFLPFVFASLLGGAGRVGAQVVINPGFESPTVVGPGSFIYTTNVTGWTFSAFDSNGGTGLTGNGSGFGPQDIGGASDPNGGLQAALMQGGGVISQSVNFTSGGNVALSLFIEARGSAGGGNPLLITLDSTVLTFAGFGTLSATSGSVFDFAISDTFAVTAGTHLLTIAGTLPFSTGDFTTFIDQVSFDAIPEPSTLALIASGLVMVLLAARRRRA